MNIRRYIPHLLVTVGVVAAAAVFVTPKLFALSESPVFCGSCHVMATEYQTFIHDGAHRRGRCVDCHLPNRGFMEHLAWKSYDGMKDVVFFFGGLVREPIGITEHGKKTVLQNCLRCHADVTARMDTTRDCTNCHRRHTHKGVGR